MTPRHLKRHSIFPLAFAGFKIVRLLLGGIQTV